LVGGEKSKIRRKREKTIEKKMWRWDPGDKRPVGGFKRDLREMKTLAKIPQGGGKVSR